MQSLSPTQPTLIVMIGIPGAGKTTFAKQFADTFNAPMISYDSLRQIISPNASYSPEEDAALKDLALLELKELFKTNKTILLDGLGAKKVDRLKLNTLAREAGYLTLFVWVQTDEITAKRRSLQPNKQTKHYDPNKLPLDEATYIVYVKQFTQPTASENQLVISGKHTYATQAKVVLRRIANFRQADEPTQPNIGNESTQKNPVKKTRNIFIR